MRAHVRRSGSAIAPPVEDTACMFRIGAMIGLGVTMGWLALVLLVVGVL
jgi:membrane protein DedA with SNARE-associated domain